MKTAFRKPRKLLYPLLIVTALALGFVPIASRAEKGKTDGSEKSSVSTISSPEQFKEIVESAGDRLLLFDLYADWCMPCRILSPMLEEIARENKEKVSVYKINVDKQPQLAAAFGVRGIPYVVLVKNKTAVHAMTGVQPKGSYVRAIDQFAAGAEKTSGDRPDGEIVEGVRVIRLSTATSPGDIYVYRGETVKLIIEKVEFPYSVSIPQYRLTRDAKVGEDMEVTFKAKETGVFQVFCNGDCPTGDGSRYGRIIVMDYEPAGDASFTELDAKESKKLIAEKKPLILDVRTPQEYHRSHIAGAKLIPLQQLDKRVSEIADHKKRDILLYCRSGNRSTVAAQILERQGFKKLHHLRPGIIGWQNAGFAVNTK